MTKPGWRLVLVLGLFPLLVGLDQATKIYAVHAMGDTMRDGILVSDHARRIMGDWLWFFIAYNPGSAFSLAPWKLVPFLSPTIFYTILTVVALGFLWVYGKRHPESLLRTGAVCIAAGAMGNLIDRWHMGHVVDFISFGVPGILWRWPTFNVADIAISTGVGILLFGEWVLSLGTKSASVVVPQQIIQAPDAAPPAPSDALLQTPSADAPASSPDVLEPGTQAQPAHTEKDA